MKIATPSLWKKSRPLSQQPPLKAKVLSSPPYLKICLGAQPPSPAERGGGCTLYFDVWVMHLSKIILIFTSSGQGVVGGEFNSSSNTENLLNSIISCDKVKFFFSLSKHWQKNFVTLSGLLILRGYGGRGGGLSESVKKGKFVTKIFFPDVVWSSKN